MYDLSGKRIWVAGHRGMVGAALTRRLAAEDCEVITAGRERADLTRQAEVEAVLADTRPDAIIIAAARVGGILANQNAPADFLYDNLMIGANMLRAAHASDVERLVFVGSSAVYPKLAEQPIVEDALLTGPLEPTHEAYSIAKIAGAKLASAYRRQYGRDYIAAMPTNLYGPGDNFDLETSHVVPALIRKVHDAKTAGAAQVEIWGTGKPRREFLHCDDCADALVFLLKHYSEESHINVGSGEDVSILGLVETIKTVVGYQGEITHDLSKPDGPPRKLMSAETLRALGWAPRIDLESGLASTYDWFLKNVAAS
ncbi:MAG: GDP-L-fucose synthase [Pseudomonadota bacterium]